MMKNYNEEEQRIREAAEAEFTEANKDNAAYRAGDARNVRRFENDKRTFARQRVAEWFTTTEVGSSITMREEKDSCEIRDEYYGGSITAYRPRVDFGWKAGENEPSKKIVAGYLNASTWDTQGGARELRHRMMMMELAVRILNEYNAVVLDWETVENPFEQARDLKVEVDRYHAVERERHDEERQRKVDAAARKAERDARRQACSPQKR